MDDEDHKRSLLERGITEAFAKLPESIRDVAIEQLAELIQLTQHTERTRCMKLCRARAELWRTTSMARSENQAVAAEARTRANEAEYLADALDTPSATPAVLDA